MGSQRRLLSSGALKHEVSANTLLLQPSPSPLHTAPWSRPFAHCPVVWALFTQPRGRVGREQSFELADGWSVWRFLEAGSCERKPSQLPHLVLPWAAQGELEQVQGRSLGLRAEGSAGAWPRSSLGH